MSHGKANCLICSKPLQYFEQAQEVTCTLCGKRETGHSLCEDGHYVCDACHREQGVRHIVESCRASDSKDPIALAKDLMRHKSIYPNGPEHHTLVGAALLAAYRNAGGEIDLPVALDELVNRSMQVPGGACGFWGTCGAATSAGMFFSIVSGSTPLNAGPWAQTQLLTSRVLGRIASASNGVRCCKRTGFAAIEETVDYVADVRGVQMELPEQITCEFFMDNAECLHRECPYFPQGRAAAEGV